MFDEYARLLIQQLPKLPDLDPVSCRRALSRAYLVVVDARIHSSDAERTLAENVDGLKSMLGRMVNALESVAVFDPLSGLNVESATRGASAFVAAEALSLMEELNISANSEPTVADPITDGHAYALIESALLYMIGGYDINAIAAVSKLQGFSASDTEGSFSLCQRSGRRLLRRVLSLCHGNIAPVQDGPAPVFSKQPALLDELYDETRARLYEALCSALDDYLAWLGGEVMLPTALQQVEKVRESCRTRQHVRAELRSLVFADIYHFASLLAAALDATSHRSVVHRVPSPQAHH